MLRTMSACVSSRIGAGVDVAAVAQHHHAVGDLLQLVEPVRDVDDARRRAPSAARSARTGGRSRARSAWRSARRGSAAGSRRSGCARSPPSAGARCPARRRAGAGRCRRRPTSAIAWRRASLSASPRMKPKRCGRRFEEQVLGDASSVGTQAQLLHHHAHAEALGVLARARARRAAPASVIVPVGRLHQAADDLRQRALARAVLAGEREHFAGVQLEVDAGEHRRGVGLADAAALQQHGQRRGARAARGRAPSPRSLRDQRDLGLDDRRQVLLRLLVLDRLQRRVDAEHGLLGARTGRRWRARGRRPASA